MELRKRIDPKMAQTIAADMAELENDTPKVENVTSVSAGIKSDDATEPCDCSGGPGKHKTPRVRGTGLIDDSTLCPKCNGEGVVPVAQG